MASPQKQAKRAQRAKAKAKQARTIRNSPPKGESEETLDDIAQGLLAILMRLAEAEAISQVEMLTTLIRDTGMSEWESLDDEIDMQIVLLKQYGQRIEGRSADWMEDASFLENYAAAARVVGREELIDAWSEAHDF
ncbi:hypothetical protein LZV00_06925 [Pseudomonas kielensis]|uniref:hypothetical protein n=1 Tax=Pseudomonas kielensis TaxID=2762577 RepID=UPI00223FFC66|nr:hypothetical protein [Pseudomonas kielensis]UZM15471.1 hypothetical protein LZV00_06865 [Pseudomonas kielensis]UZM15483.1 hypothetical protein LZV00_06925 [Pseudomonas kielensis]